MSDLPLTLVYRRVLTMFHYLEAFIRPGELHEIGYISYRYRPGEGQRGGP